MSDSDLSKTLTSTLPQKQRAKRLAGKVYVLHPAEVAGIYPLAAGEVILGRAPEGAHDILLAHDTISRRHVEIKWVGRNRAYFAKDLGSHNGSSVDGHTLQEEMVELEHGSVLKLGSAVMVFELSEIGDYDCKDELLKGAIPGHSTLIGRTRHQIERCAADPAPVLVFGETGSGKEKVAQEIHRLSGRRGKLLSINCAALNAQLIESQLFGHVKGAFTGATESQQGLFRAAQGGTLFLDELGELPLELQPKLLRVLQEGEVMSVGGTSIDRVDVRVIAATNLDLVQEVEDGNFRRDLYARLSLWQVNIPPLRKRRSDLFLWLSTLAQEWSRARDNKEAPSLRFEGEAVVALLLSDWKENLRGLSRLQHELFSHSALTQDESYIFTKKDLPEWISQNTGPKSQTLAEESSSVAEKRPLKPSKEELEAVLAANEWSIRATAKHFDRDRKQIYRWIDKYELKNEGAEES